MSRRQRMNVKESGREVLFASDPIVKVSGRDIGSMKRLAERNERKRIRLCAHRDVDDTLHEMLIVHTKDTYVRPHKHLKKSESVHIVEGVVDLVVFDESGGVSDVIKMGDYSSGRVFYYRMSGAYYHTLRVVSDVLVFHETTGGPFHRSDTVFAGWAPEESDRRGVDEFMERMTAALRAFESAR